MRFAGSGDAQTRDLIIEIIELVLKVEVLEVEFLTGQSSKNKLDRYSQLNILSVLALSLTIVCAGYCDLKAFKVLKILKRKIKTCHDFDAVYGFNMAIHMSVGFLFLGNGTYTFGNSDFQILCLLLATFPVFPSSINDNRFHLQALRHFYVLAIQDNLFHLIDIDTKKPLKLALELQTLGTSGVLTKHKLISPLFLNSSDEWKSLRLLDDDFHRLAYTFSSSESKRFSRPRFLFVKKKYPYSVELKNFKDFVLSKMSFTEFDNSSLFCASKPLTLDSNFVFSIIRKHQFRIFLSQNLSRCLYEKLFTPLTHQSPSFLAPPDASLRQSTAHLFHLLTRHSQFHEKTQAVVRQNKLRYLFSMIYSILKKDKSSLLGMCDQFLLNKPFASPLFWDTLSLKQIFDVEVICAFNDYLSVINNKRPSKMSCLFDEWDEHLETRLLKKNLSLFEKTKTVKILDIFKKYLQNSCQSFLEHFLQLSDPRHFESQMKTLLLSLLLNRFQGKQALLELLKQIRDHKLRNPREVIYILSRQRGIVLKENFLSLVLEVYATIPPSNNLE